MATVFSCGGSTAFHSQVFSSELPVQNLITYSAIFLSLPCRAQLNCQPSTELTTELVRVRVRVTLQLAVYYQSVHLGAELLETHNQYFFFQQNTYCYMVIVFI
jgi:hypothetical protein